VDEVRGQGARVSHIHVKYLNPLPPDLGNLLKGFKKVLVPEMNLGQLRTILRATYLVDAVGLNKVQGQPFKVSEIVDGIRRALEG
jgi:2-oxoglutarate ferredoxin oxidoreductase subunit alpha